MARETKVGLLAGLAFIVCFAIILANRGRNGPPGLSDSVLTDAALNVPAAVQRNAAASRNSQIAAPADRRRAAPSSQPARPNVNRQPNGAAAQLADSTPASGAELPGERTTAESPVRLTPRSASNAEGYPVGGAGATPGGIHSDPNRETLERVLASRPQPNQPDRTSLTAPNASATPTEPPVITGQPLRNIPARDSRSAANPFDPAARSSDAATADPASPRGKEYKVQPSDTLSSIAAAQYGTKSHSAVNTIFDANRGVLSDPDHLKVGSVLVIPTPPASEPTKANEASGARPPKPAETQAKGLNQKAKVAAAESALAAESAAFRWYQVKKNDRYANIAREQLGDASRWKELYEINKDKFPDPQRIREGVRIKLPAVASNDGGGSRR